MPPAPPAGAARRSWRFSGSWAGVVWALGPGFDQTQLDPGIVGGALQHSPETGVPHEMGTGAGSQIPAPGQGLHGAVIDLLITALGAVYGLAGLGKGRRVQDNVVVLAGGQGGQQVKNVGGLVLDHVAKAVAGTILFRAGK